MKPASKKVDLDQMIASRLSERSPDPAAIDAALTNVITLNVRDDCRLYERNPRTVRNEKYDEIKESIRTRGLDQMIAVTQRPGEKQYIPAKGGNTRLEILQELVAEGHMQFLHMDFVKVPYRSEAALLAAHMVENDQRSGLLFWDAARSTFDLKQEVERERGGPMSLREFSEHLKAGEGIQASPALLSHYGFTMKHLADLACAASQLSRRDVQDRFIPARSRLAPIAAKIGAEEALDQAWTLAIDHMRERYVATKSLDFAAFTARLDENFAQRINLAVDELQRALQILQANPDAESASLVRDAKQHAPAPCSSLADTQASDGADESSGRDSANAATQTKQPPQHETSNASTSRQNGEHDTGAGAQPSSKQPPADSRGSAERELWHALGELVTVSHLRGCLLSVDELPLRFMVEIPKDVGGDLGSLQEQALQGGDYAERYYAWWWLVLLSQQNTPAGLAALSLESDFKLHAESTDSWQEACDNLLGDPVYADGSYHVVRRMTDPDDATGLVYLRVIQAVRQFNQAFPERSKDSFWHSVGVPVELTGGAS